jgi:hypothetical protein
MTTRAKRVVWTVPGAASDLPGNTAARFGPPLLPSRFSAVFERREGEQ